MWGGCFPLTQRAERALLQQKRKHEATAMHSDDGTGPLGAPAFGARGRRAHWATHPRTGAAADPIEGGVGAAGRLPSVETARASDRWNFRRGASPTAFNFTVRRRTRLPWSIDFDRSIDRLGWAGSVRSIGMGGNFGADWHSQVNPTLKQSCRGSTRPPADMLQSLAFLLFLIFPSLNHQSSIINPGPTSPGAPAPPSAIH